MPLLAYAVVSLISHLILYTTKKRQRGVSIVLLYILFISGLGAE